MKRVELGFLCLEALGNVTDLSDRIGGAEHAGKLLEFFHDIIKVEEHVVDDDDLGKTTLIERDEIDGVVERFLKSGLQIGGVHLSSTFTKQGKAHLDGVRHHLSPLEV